MPVKLVRTDVDIQKKISLAPGSHIIGRGSILEVFDKRVSRKHAKIEVSNDTVVVNALHHNPLFYIKRGCSKSEALTLDSKVVLSSGDKIGFLPRTYWFEIIVVNSVNSSEEANNNNELNENEDILKTPEEIIGTTGETLDEDTQQDAAQSQNSEEANKTLSPPKRRRSASEDTLNLDMESQDSGFDAGKKIKLEPPDNGYGNFLQGASSSNILVNPSTSVRERCYYGARCYRFDFQAQPSSLGQSYSHPRDSDWGTGDKGQCPNGAGCTKSDPRHWDTHTHPPGTTWLPQLQGKRKNKKKRKQIEDTTDESDQDMDGLNIRACRRNRGDSVSDAYGSDFDFDFGESEPDPYGSEESDEWQPKKNGK